MIALLFLFLTALAVLSTVGALEAGRRHASLFTGFLAVAFFAEFVFQIKS